MLTAKGPTCEFPFLFIDETIPSKSLGDGKERELAESGLLKAPKSWPVILHRPQSLPPMSCRRAGIAVNHPQANSPAGAVHLVIEGSLLPTPRTTALVFSGIENPLVTGGEPGDCAACKPRCVHAPTLGGSQEVTVR